MDETANVTQISALFEPVPIVTGLITHTRTLIPSTKSISAIKKLIEIYDILNLNKEILEKFSTIKNEWLWDEGSLQQVVLLKRELIVYHRPTFQPPIVLDNYSTKIEKFVRLANHYKLSTLSGK